MTDTPTTPASKRPMNIPCPECGCRWNDVVDSRPTDTGLFPIRRYRTCVQCHHRFTTYEIAQDRPTPATILTQEDLNIMIRSLERMVERLKDVRPNAEEG